MTSLPTIIESALANAQAVKASRRAATRLPLDAIRDLSAAAIELDALGRLAADWIAAREEMFQARLRGDADGEHAADDRQDALEDQFIERLVALGFLHIHEQEPSHGSAV